MTPESAATVEERVGHPREKWEDLKASVQDKAISEFIHVQDAWLNLMWTLDAYRIAEAVPRGFKDQGAINRGKGNWFAELLALLLENRTHHRIAARQAGLRLEAHQASRRRCRAGCRNGKPNWCK